MPQWTTCNIVGTQTAHNVYVVFCLQMFGKQTSLRLLLFQRIFLLAPPQPNTNENPNWTFSIRFLVQLVALDLISFSFSFVCALFQQIMFIDDNYTSGRTNMWWPRMEARTRGSLTQNRIIQGDSKCFCSKYLPRFNMWVILNPPLLLLAKHIYFYFVQSKLNFSFNKCDTKIYLWESVVFQTVHHLFQTP